MHATHRAIVLAGSVLGFGSLPARFSPGDPIPDIDIVVIQHPGGQSFHSVTDASGVFSFTLAPGTYTLRIGSPRSTASPSARSAPASRTVGAAWQLLTLPDSIGTAWSYQLRLADNPATIARISLVAPAAATVRTGTAAPTSRELEIQLVVALPPSAATQRTLLRGRVEARR